MPANWVNKPTSFKRTDPRDAERYQFAQRLPNFTRDVKSMLDEMQAGGFTSFEAWLKSLERRIVELGRFEDEASREITQDDEFGVVEALMDVGQFM
jgi:hypothetical protein